MSDLAPFWIREMQARIESDWIKMHEDQHRARMREITATLSPDALHELWENMEPEESEAEKARMEISRQRLQEEREKVALERSQTAVLPPASFTKIGEPKKLYKAITITEWREVDE